MAEDKIDEDGHADSSAEPSGMEKNEQRFRNDQNLDISARRPSSPSNILADESARLRELQASVRDQDDLERDIGRQVGWLFFYLPFKAVSLTRATIPRRTNFLQNKQTRGTKGD